MTPVAAREPGEPSDTFNARARALRDEAVWQGSEQVARHHARIAEIRAMHIGLSATVGRHAEGGEGAAGDRYAADILALHAAILAAGEAEIARLYERCNEIGQLQAAWVETTAPMLGRPAPHPPLSDEDEALLAAIASKFAPAPPAPQAMVPVGAFFFAGPPGMLAPLRRLFARRPAAREAA